MNLLNLLTKEKKVAGIEISDSVIRIAFFKTNKGSDKKNDELLKTKNISSANNSEETKQPTKDSKEELILIEEPIAANIIADGVVIDSDLLGKTLKGIWERAGLETDYAVVAIPDDKIYSRVFSFPKSIESARLSEAMRLAISFQLPIKTEGAYLDWERLPGTATENEILLSTIPKDVARGYINSLELAGIKIIALESHIASIARAVQLTPNETTLFLKRTPDGASMFALENGVFRFSRTLPANFVTESQVHSEIAKLKTAIEAEKKNKITTKELVDASIREEYSNYPTITEPRSKWLISLGAAIRGKIPEGEDNMVSLLPVGTEEAYSYQKATTFISLVRNTIIGVSIFFTVAFIASYLFVFSLSQNQMKTIAALSVSPVAPELMEQEDSINRINSVTKIISDILSETPVWSGALEEIVGRIPDGIIVSAFSAPSITGTFTITGTGQNRDILNQFKKSLQDSPMLSDINLPITNLGQKALIPFSITFRIKDPSALYYK